MKGSKDPLIRVLHVAVLYCVKILAILIVIVIWLALIDVIVHLFQRFQPPYNQMFTVENLIGTLGDFLAVLIAIEIFLNIVFYLRKDAIHVSLVLATALTAAARKVIILDYVLMNAYQIYAIAAVILAVGISYWLVNRQKPSDLDLP